MPTVETRVRSKDLPITVEYSIGGEDPSVGLSAQVDWSIIAIGKRKLKKPPMWLYRQLKRSDEEAIEQACFDGACALDAERRIEAWEDRRNDEYFEFDQRR